MRMHLEDDSVRRQLLDCLSKFFFCPEILQQCLLDGQWLYWSASDAALCAFLKGNGPFFLQGGVAYTQQHWARPADAFIVCAWSHVLMSRPRNVFLEWLRMPPSRLKEMVVWKCLETEAWPRDNPATFRLCLSALMSSFGARSATCDSDPSWAALCCQVIPACWKLCRFSKCKNDALHLLGYAVFLHRAAFLSFPLALQCLQDTCAAQDVCGTGLLLCLRNTLITVPYHVKPLFWAVVLSWMNVCTQPPELDSLQALCDYHLAAENVSVIITYLADSATSPPMHPDVVHGFMALRAVCNLLLVMDMHVAKPLISCLAHLPLFLHNRQVPLLLLAYQEHDLRLLVQTCMRVKDTGDSSLDSVIVWLSRVYAARECDGGSTAAGSAAGSATGSATDVFVHPMDHAWNARLWRMLDNVWYAAELTAWRLKLLPFLFEVPTGHIVKHHVQEVLNQVVGF